MNFGKNKITFICARIIEIASLMETLNFPFIEFGIHLIKKNKIRAQSIIILEKKAKIKYLYSRFLIINKRLFRWL